MPDKQKDQKCDCIYFKDGMCMEPTQPHGWPDGLLHVVFTERQLLLHDGK